MVIYYRRESDCRSPFVVYLAADCCLMVMTGMVLADLGLLCEDGSRCYVWVTPQISSWMDPQEVSCSTALPHALVHDQHNSTVVETISISFLHPPWLFRYSPKAKDAAFGGAGQVGGDATLLSEEDERRMKFSYAVAEMIAMPPHTKQLLLQVIFEPTPNPQIV